VRSDKNSRIICKYCLAHTHTHTYTYIKEKLNKSQVRIQKIQDSGFVYICLPHPLEMKLQTLSQQLTVWNQTCVCFGKNFSKSLGCIHTKRIQTLSIHNSYPVTQNTVYYRSTYGRTKACLFYNTFSFSDHVVLMAGLTNGELQLTWKKQHGLTEVTSSYLTFPKGPSAKARGAPQPKAYCAALCCSLNTDSLTLCLLQRNTGLLTKNFPKKL
jgi:hypothetical protein